MRVSPFAAAPGKSTCAAWMYRSVMVPCECPAFSWTYACRLPRRRPRASAQCAAGRARAENGLVMPALCSAIRIYWRLIFDGSRGVPTSGWQKTSSRHSGNGLLATVPAGIQPSAGRARSSDARLCSSASGPSADERLAHDEPSLEQLDVAPPEREQLPAPEGGSERDLHETQREGPPLHNPGVRCLCTELLVRGEKTGDFSLGEHVHLALLGRPSRHGESEASRRSRRSPYEERQLGQAASRTPAAFPTARGASHYPAGYARYENASSA
jgi:hypothetical protein